MKSHALVLIAFVGLACAEAPPASRPTGPPKAAAAEAPLPIPSDLAPALNESIEIGRTLYLLDKASAIGTDVVLAKVPDFRGRGVGGWLTVRAAEESGKLTDTFAVSFISKEQPFRTLFRVDVPLQGKPTLTELSPPKPLDELGERLFRARQTAIAAVPRGARPWNPVVLPGAAVGRPDAIAVYLLAAETAANEMVFGIHYRVLVSEDGATIKQVVPLSKSALVVRSDGSDVPKGAKRVATFVSQIVTDWPMETHVFVSLLHHREPIFVATQRGLWRVEGDVITLIDDRRPGQPPH